MPDTTPIKERALSFIATRQHHLLETAEDYTEMVADLIASKGQARTCDIAKRMGISHVTALKTIRRLQDKGYLETSMHKPITLTSKGEELAVFSKKKHQVLMDFLTKLGVPEDIAAIDVEGMEHHVSHTTLEVLEKHIQSLMKEEPEKP